MFCDEQSQRTSNIRLCVLMSRAHGMRENARSLVSISQVSPLHSSATFNGLSQQLTLECCRHTVTVDGELRLFFYFCKIL